jgi:expansin (peptidoglycan-binding protein)
MTYTSVTGTYTYFQIGKLVICTFFMNGTTGGTASSDIRATLPVTASGTNFRGGAAVTDTGFAAGTWYLDSTTRVAFRKADSSNFGLGASRTAGATIIYEAA